MGATDEEIKRLMPGDEIVERPNFVATRAVTVKTLPEAVWPWIVQIGSGRAGWYSYDRIDNGGVPSADRLVPELQHVEVGDLIPFVPGANVGMWVESFEPNRWMLWRDKKGEATWAWRLYPLGEGRTRGLRTLDALRKRDQLWQWASALWTSGEKLCSARL